MYFNDNKSDVEKKYEVVVENFRFGGYCLKKGDEFQVAPIGDGMVAVYSQWFKLPVTVTQLDVNTHCKEIV